MIEPFTMGYTAIGGLGDDPTLEDHAFADGGAGLLLVLHQQDAGRSRRFRGGHDRGGTCLGWRAGVGRQSG